jgi:mercuric ion transport protein
MSTSTPRVPLVAGVLAALAASVCCVGPLVLLTLGVSGAWIGNLTALQPYRPFLIGLTLLFIGLAFRKLYLVPQVCVPGTACADPKSLRRQRLVFWLVSLLLTGLIVVPWVVPLFY